MTARAVPAAQRDRIHRATALIRALTGVVDARVEADGSGIRTVVVVAEPALSVWEIARNVQSALLASLGLTIDTAVVEVTRPQADGASSDQSPREPADRPVGPPTVPSASPRAVPAQNGGVAENGGVVGNGAAKKNGAAKRDGARARRGNGSAHRSATVELNADGNLRGPESPAGPTLHGPSAAGLAATKPGAATVARLEIEPRSPGRIACRVVVATSDRIAAGEGDGTDTPAGRVEAAARAVVAASRVPGIDLDAVRVVELAGRKYVIVAVRSWSGRELEYRAEVAAVAATPEAAAADAALSAVLR